MTAEYQTPPELTATTEVANPDEIKSISDQFLDTLQINSRKSLLTLGAFQFGGAILAFLNQEFLSGGTLLLSSVGTFDLAVRRK